MDFINTLILSMPDAGNFISRWIIWMMEACSSIAVGILLFTLILKVISFPFDLYSRAVTKKNSIKMEEMRPELEKLQKQYANDKALYSQKMMALYKKNGYSMAGSCLSMIVTMVIFIFAINGFNSASAYENRKYYYDMSASYNEVIYKGMEADGTYIIYDANNYNKTPNKDNGEKDDIRDNLQVNDGLILEKTTPSLYKVELSNNNNGQIYFVINDDGSLTSSFEKIIADFGSEFGTSENPIIKELSVKIKQNTTEDVKNGRVVYEDGGAGKFIKFETDRFSITVLYDAEKQETTIISCDYYIQNTKVPDNDNITVWFGRNGTNNSSYYYLLETGKSYIGYKRHYSVNIDGSKNFGTKEYYVIESNLGGENSLKSAENNNLLVNGKTFAESGLTGSAFIKEICRAQAKVAFDNAPKSFLWVKNIWGKDSPLEKMVSADVSTLSAADGGCSCSCSGVNNYTSQDVYNELTHNLEQEKTLPNGYFILCILTAALSLVTQLIMMKTQKAQLELQSVNGQGASTQKMMTWMMPIMMAIFSFMFTASFSVYMIASSTISIGTTLLINFIISKKYKTKAEKAKGEVVRGRVYTPPQKTKAEIEREKKIAKQKAQGKQRDFIKGDQTEIKNKLLKK